MLINTLKEIEKVINNMEHPQKSKGEFYRYIDNLVERLLNEKFEGQYTVYQISNYKDTDSERDIQLYKGSPKEEEDSIWQWSKNKPSINIWYKIKLTSIEVGKSWNSSKQYNLKNFNFVVEYDNYEYNLNDKFAEIEEDNNKRMNARNEKITKSKEEFVLFLEELKQAVINNEDINETRKEVYYEFSRPNGIDKTESQLKTFLKQYNEYIQMNKQGQE